MTQPKLKFTFGNAKLSNSIATLSIPAGHTCSFAKGCLSKANRNTGKITDGKECRFRCFAASEECRFSSVRKARWYNFNMLKGLPLERMANLIQQSLPKGILMLRINLSGDYFSESYFLAWLNVSLNNPQTIFYGYTKAIPFWIKYKKDMPSNFRLTASLGGIHDPLVFKHKLKYVDVVFSTKEAKDRGLELDHDDSHAYAGKNSFAVLLHGTQPASTNASRALEKLKKLGMGGYNEKKKNSRKINPVKIYIPLPLKYSPSIGRGYGYRGAPKLFA